MSDNNIWRPISEAPFDKFVLLMVDSDYKNPKYDYVYCKQYIERCKNVVWYTAQGDRLTDSHTGKIYGYLDAPEGFDFALERTLSLTDELHQKALGLGCDGIRDLFDKYEFFRSQMLQNS